jgi:hypothetical protein
MGRGDPTLSKRQPIFRNGKGASRSPPQSCFRSGWIRRTSLRPKDQLLASAERSNFRVAVAEMGAESHRRSRTDRRGRSRTDPVERSVVVVQLTIVRCDGDRVELVGRTDAPVGGVEAAEVDSRRARAAGRSGVKLPIRVSDRRGETHVECDRRADTPDGHVTAKAGRVTNAVAVNCGPASGFALVDAVTTEGHIDRSGEVSWRGTVVPQLRCLVTDTNTEC